ncbi:hypothetical protein PQX77_010101 [Marasmius sp. AFHP31]|nr:hypothetical protein PQX77_010101 [Marasmius sp. AFHP31]
MLVSGENLDQQSLLRLQPTSFRNDHDGLPILLTDVLRSLNIPSERESARIRSLISEEENTLEEIAQEISELRTKIEDSRDWELSSSIAQSLCRRLSMLDGQRYLLLERVRQLRQLSSPVRRVPCEVWERIISFNCQCDFPGSYAFVIGYFGRPACDYHERLPLYPLCHTSYIWRAIAFHTPSYWSRYKIHLPCCRQNNLSLLKAHLIKSRDTPLDVELYGSLELCSTWSKLGGSGSDAFHQIFPHLPRCKKLVLDAQAFERIVGYDHSTGWSFEHLTSISFDMTMGSQSLSGNIHPDFWAAIFDAPKLTTALTSSLLPVQYLHYPRLTTLTLTRLTEDETQALIRLLPTCTSLRNLAIREPARFQPVHVPSVFGTCPLENLTISASTFPTDVASLFAALSFPSLHSLDVALGPEGKLHAPGSGGSDDWESQLSSFKNSTLSLESLAIQFQNSGHCTNRLLSVLPLLRALPALASQRDRHQRFEIAIGNINNGSSLTHPITRLVSHFSIGGDPTTLCPRLKQLTLVDEGFPVFQADDIAPLVEMIKSRNTSDVVCRLISFTMIYGIQPRGQGHGFFVDDTYVLRPGDAARIRELKEKGVTFSREVLLPPAFDSRQEISTSSLRVGLGLASDVVFRLKFRND